METLEKTLERLMSKVDKTRPPVREDLTPCWWWTGRVTNKGYGEFPWQGTHWGTHRVSWTLHNGPIPDGMQILHHCDNRRCIRPDHLYVGTNQQNVDDRETRGRGLTGRPGRKPLLTKEQVLRMREMAARGASQTALANAFGIAQSSVWAILHRKNYQYLDFED